MKAPLEPLHSPFGGSSAARVLHCPASVGLVAKVPNHSQPPSAFANRGTALHTALTLLINNARPLNALLGNNINNYVITRADLANALLPTYAYIKQLLAPPKTEFYLEHRVAFPNLPGAFGTLDLIVRSGRTTHVIDFKFGTNIPVPARYQNSSINPQLLFYAAAARHSLPNFFADVDKINLTILPGAGIESSTVVTTKELDAFVIAYRTACNEALSPVPRLNPGPWCRFCLAKLICPAHPALSGRRRSSRGGSIV